MVQVFPETVLADALRQILIGGGDDAHVSPPFPVAAHRRVGALLQHAQQHGLRLVPQRAYLVEEQRAAFGHAEIPFRVLLRTRERAFGVPEQQRRGKFFRDDAAIHRHKGHRAAVALLVYPAGDGLLARTVGAEDKHGHLHRGNQCGHAFYLTCRRAAKPEQGFSALRQR